MCNDYEISPSQCASQRPTPLSFLGHRTYCCCSMASLSADTWQYVIRLGAYDYATERNLYQVHAQSRRLVLRWSTSRTDLYCGAMRADQLDFLALYFGDLDPSLDECKAFRVACECGHVSIVQQCLRDSRVNVSAKDNKPFALAAFCGRADIVDMLLKHGLRHHAYAYRNERINLFNFALYAAGMQSHTDVVRIIVAYVRTYKVPYDTDRGRGRWLEHSYNPRDWTANVYKHAIDEDNVPMVKLLVEHHFVNPYADVDFHSTVHDTIENGYLALMTYLITLPAARQHLHPNDTLLHAACTQPNVAFVTRLVEHLQLTIDKNDHKLLYYAVTQGCVETVGLLLDTYHVKPHLNDQQIIQEAASLGYVDVVRRLLQDPRVDPAECDNEAYRLAAEHGHVDVIAVLAQDPRTICFGTPVVKQPTQDDTQTPMTLMKAVREANIESVSTLLRQDLIRWYANGYLRIATQFATLQCHILEKSHYVRGGDRRAAKKQALLSDHNTVRLLLLMSKVKLQLKRSRTYVKTHLAMWQARGDAKVYCDKESSAARMRQDDYTIQDLQAHRKQNCALSPRTRASIYKARAHLAKWRKRGQKRVRPLAPYMRHRMDRRRRERAAEIEHERPHHQRFFDEASDEENPYTRSRVWQPALRAGMQPRRRRLQHLPYRPRARTTPCDPPTETTETLAYDPRREDDHTVAEEEEPVMMAQNY